MIRLLAVALFAAAAIASESNFVYSASFAYWDYPKDLWPALFVRLKNTGFNTVQIPARAPAPDLIEVLRLARRLGLGVWLEGGVAAPELDPYRASRGGAILQQISGKGAVWQPAEERRLLFAADFAPLRRMLQKQPVIAGLDAGWPVGEDIRAAPSDPSNYLFAFREALAAGARAINCSAVLEGRSPPAREPAFGWVGESRPQAAVLERNGALIRQFGPLLATLLGQPGENAVSLVRQPGQALPRFLRLSLLASQQPRGPAFVSALNYSEDRPATGTIALRDPRTGRQILLRGISVPPRQGLLMPINLPLAQPEVCPTCGSFAPDERLAWATAELLSVTFENGVLAMEFIAPAEGELVLELARQPDGPLITGARLRSFDWDEKTHHARIRIPAGSAPDFRTRVGLGMEAPDTSVFLKGPPRLIIGSTARVSASFSSPELCQRSRLLAPAGWRVQPEPSGEKDVEYRIEVPAHAVAGESVTLSVEAEGKIAQSLTLPVAQAWSLRIEPEETLHPRPGVQFPIRPHLATVVLPRRRSYTIHLRNNYDEIRTFEVAASGDDLKFSSSRVEVSIGGGLEREVNLYVSPAAPRPGLYLWTLEVRQGAQRIETPLALAVLSEDESITYQFDVDRDGTPEWVLENPRIRTVFSTPYGGRSTEFLLKDKAFNAFTAHGALALDTAVQVEARRLGPGQLELRSADLVRRISLRSRDTFFDVEQQGGPAEWAISGLPGSDPGSAQLVIRAPDARLEKEQKRYSTRFRLHFPPDMPRRARFSIVAESPAAP